MQDEKENVYTRLSLTDKYLRNPKNLLKLSFFNWKFMSFILVFFTRLWDEWLKQHSCLVKIPNLSNPEHTLETIYHLQDFDKNRKAFLSVSNLSIFHAQCPNCITLYLTGDRHQVWRMSPEPGICLCLSRPKSEM